MSGKPRVFVSQPIAESAVKRLRALGSVKVFPDDSRIMPHRALIEAVKKADILFCLLHDKIDRAVLAANPKLRAVAAQSITPSNIDVAEATKRGIPVTVVPPVTTEATADLTFGLMLAVARRMVEGDKLVRAGKFPGSQSRHLLGSIVHGRTLGLIGGGGLIGKAVARRAHGFDMRVLYWTPRRKPESEEREAGITFVPLDDLLGESDFVSLHSPLTGETHHQIGARELGLMKKSAVIVNTARGPIIDEAALVRALKARRIAERDQRADQLRRQNIRGVKDHMAISPAGGQAIAIRGLLCGDDAVEAGACEGVDQCPGNNAERGRGDERQQPHAGKGRHQVDQEEWKGRHQPQEQQIAEGVVAEALRQLDGTRSSSPQQRFAERGARHQEDKRRSRRCPDHGRRGADRKAEQKPADYCEEYRARQRQGDDGYIERDIGEYRQDPLFAHEGVDGHAVPDQRRKRDPAIAEDGIGGAGQKDDRDQCYQPAAQAARSIGGRRGRGHPRYIHEIRGPAA